MTRILVTGAGGFIGGHLLAHLAGTGLAVRAASRRLPSPGAFPERFEHCVIPGIGQATDWSRAVEGVDVVVHLAARAHTTETKRSDRDALRDVNVGGTRSLAQAAARAGVRRVVLISSSRAMGEESPEGRCYTEDSPCRPGDSYGQSKRDAEQALLEAAAGSATETVILRPPIVYGPGVRANFLRLLNLIRLGVPLPLGSVKNRRSILFVENLTSAIARCLDHPGAAGQVFLVADEQALSTRELVLRLGECLGRRPRLLSVPVPVLAAAVRILGRSEDIRRLTGSLLLSTARIRRALEWDPPFEAAEGLRRTAAWFQGSRS